MDIDAYAGVIAYAELLQRRGLGAQAVSTAPLNASITKTVRVWPVNLSRTYTPHSSDTYTLIDTSEPEFFEKFVVLDRVDEVIDHHTGQEDFWKTKIGTSAHLEFIGAACTQVYEAWLAAGLIDQMSPTSAKLLATGILDNTLNFRASLTTERDVTAYRALVQIGGLPANWPEQYFLECQETIEKTLPTAIQQDVKIKNTPGLAGKITFGQLAVWDATSLLKQIDTIKNTLGAEHRPWFMNLISISEGKNYLVAEDAIIQSWAKKVVNAEFAGSNAITDRLWLRKEILRAAQQIFSN